MMINSLTSAGVYLIRNPEGQHKIGCTSNAGMRLATYEDNVDLVKFFKCVEYRQLESTLHCLFPGKRIGNTEWFNLTPAEVKFLCDLPANIGGSQLVFLRRLIISITRAEHKMNKTLDLAGYVALRRAKKAQGVR